MPSTHPSARTSPSSAANKPTLSLGGILCFLTALTSNPSRADVGLRVGPQGGIEMNGDMSPYAGLDLRLTAPGSPLTIQPTYDYVFLEDRTVFHLGANVLYEAPLAFPLKPYLGIGAKLSSFALDEESMTEDSEGYRLGMNLLAGARLDLPWVSPFVQLTQGVGEFDDLAVGGGVGLTLRRGGGTASSPEPMRMAVTPYLANNAFGDVQSGRLGLGLSLAVFPWERFGFEVDGQMHGHFYRDEDLADQVEEGVDLNSTAATLTAGGIVRYCASSPSYGSWCPYAAAGIGMVHSWFDAASHTPEAPSSSETQTDLALTAGVGIAHQFTRHVGLRMDARYFYAFVDGGAGDIGYFEDFGFLRLSPGVSIGF